MSGHSKWATTKHKKAAIDAKRGKIFSKLAKELTVAAKNGGGNPDTNPRLRTVLATAKEVNMPSDNIDRAVKRGTGELPGVIYEEISYEGYGPGGVAIMVDVLTDNKNRTTADVRNIFSKKGGNLAGTGSVSWIFSKKGFIIVDKKKIDEEKLMSIVLDAGAEDLKSDEQDVFEVITKPQDFEIVKKALEDNKIEYASADITMIPSNSVKVTGSIAKQVLSLVEELEDHDDVQDVYVNFDIPDEILEGER